MQNNITTLDAAKSLAEQGMAVFPIIHGKKIPATPHGFHDATKDHEKINALFHRRQCNIGIKTGAESGVIVIDDDAYKNNGQSIPLLEARLGKLPVTRMAKTRAGGVHYFFKHPGPTVRIKCSAGSLANAVDIKADGGYVVAAPSWVESDDKGPAGHYEWINNAPIADLPEKWLNRLQHNSERSDSRAVIASWKPSQNTINILGNCFFPPEKVKDGDGRESTILRYAARLRAQGFDQPQIDEMLLEYNERSIEPPLDIDVVLDRSRRYATWIQKDAPDRAELDLTGGFIGVSSSPPLPRNWVLEGILISGKSAVLAGFGGVSKTQFCIHLAISIATGKPYMGRPVNAGSAMLLLGEEDDAEIARRVNAVVRYENLTTTDQNMIAHNIRGFGLVGQDIRLSSKSAKSIQETGSTQKIIDAAKALGNVRVIVLDHAGLVHGGDFNAREDAAFTMRLVNHIAQETGAAVILLAHSPKASAGDEDSNASQVAGSTAFVDQARCGLILATMRKAEAKVFGITEADRTKYASLTVVKNNYGPSGTTHWFKRFSYDEVGLLQHTILSRPSAPLKGLAAVESAIHNFITSNPGRFSKTYVRENYFGKNGPFRASKADVEIAINKLLDDGRLKQRPPTKSERETYSLGRCVQNVLDVTPSQKSHA